MRLLVITYGFPPVAGMTPLRIAHFVREATNRGHEVTVVAADRPPGYTLDAATAALVPSGVAVRRLAPGPLARLFRGEGGGAKGPAPDGGSGAAKQAVGRIARRAYGLLVKPLLRPDVTFEWYRAARPVVARLAASGHFDAVYSFAYPFSCHHLGHVAHRAGGLPWVMDYGDPWTLNPMWDVPAWRIRRDRADEARFLAAASAVIVTTEATGEAFASGFPDATAGKIAVSTCAFDAAAYAEAEPERRPGDGRFRIVHTGITGLANRSEERLFEVLAALEGRDWEFVSAGRILAGAEGLHDAVRRAGLQDNVDLRGQIPHAAAVALQKSADLLLAWGWGGGLQIPAKVFEYIGARRPILLITGDTGDAAARVVTEGRRGWAVADETAAIAGALDRALQAWREGTWPTEFDLARDDTHSWQVQAGVIVDAVEAAVR